LRRRSYCGACACPMRLRGRINTAAKKNALAEFSMWRSGLKSYLGKSKKELKSVSRPLLVVTHVDPKRWPKFSPYENKTQRSRVFDQKQQRSFIVQRLGTDTILEAGQWIGARS
jgi:hypothetical protein